MVTLFAIWLVYQQQSNIATLYFASVTRVPICASDFLHLLISIEKMLKSSKYICCHSNCMLVTRLPICTTGFPDSNVPTEAVYQQYLSNCITCCQNYNHLIANVSKCRKWRFPKIYIHLLDYYIILNTDTVVSLRNCTNSNLATICFPYH